MLSFVLKLLGSGALVVLVCLASAARADATVFRDRAAFNAASQNLQTVDFESVTDLQNVPQIEGLVFESIGGKQVVMGPNGTKVLMGSTVGEITRVFISLPPGTTAVGCDQFTKPMIISIPSGESVTMDQSDTSTFVGFVSDQPIQSLTVLLDFPEPTPSAFIDNISFGQRRAGNEPPLPLLLTTSSTARAAALDSVTTHSESFGVLSLHNFATDGHTRITLFLAGVALVPADQPFVTVQAEDQQQHVFDLPVEGTARVRNLSWMSQVTVRLPDALSGVGNVNITVTVLGKASNKAPIQIQ